MMLVLLVIGAILIYLLLEPTYKEANKLWLTGIIGTVLSVVGLYNFFVSRSATFAGPWYYCLLGGGYRAGLIALIGFILLAATGIAWLKSNKEHSIANKPSDQELL